MGKGGYKVIDQGAMYFVSFAVVSWVDVSSKRVDASNFKKAGDSNSRNTNYQYRQPNNQPRISSTRRILADRNWNIFIIIP